MRLLSWVTVARTVYVGMMVQMILVLPVLGSSMLGMSDRVNLSATIPPGLQDYLCRGLLKSNMAIELDDGEHRISPGPLCHIFNESNITITGSSTKTTTVRCEGEGRGFAFISVQNLTTKNITFINCGQQLHSPENVLFTDCLFQNNSNVAISLISSVNTNIANCIFEGNSATDGYGGGAVGLSGSIVNVSITNCTFQNNNAAHGGAVAVNGSTVDVSITNCTFQHNSATYGGAVWLDGSTLNVHILDCIFQNNGNASNGGAVWLSGSTGNASITNCTFLNNKAYVNGGGMWLYESTDYYYYNITKDTFQIKTAFDINIMGCTFLNNSAIDGIGGAMWFDQSTYSISIKYCTFQDNSATFGGVVGMVNTTGNVNIMGCTFLNNSATDGSGGAVWLNQSTVSISITYSTFQNNVVTGGSGGAVRLGGSVVNVIITNCIFEYNNAWNAGAVLFHESAGDVSITNCTFKNNSAGTVGAVWLYQSSGNISITNCIFENNNATSVVDNGGVVFFNRSTITCDITNSTFQNNNAGYSCAVEMQGLSGEFSIANSTFQNNIGGNGGAVEIDGLSGQFSIVNSIFQNNIAGSGGAVMLNGLLGEVSIVNSTFQNNIAVSGGCVDMDRSEGNLIITNCTFHNCVAYGDGGAFNIAQSTVNANITNCIFHKNSANHSGGAVLYRDGDVSITSCTFHNNTAIYGGAILISPKNTLYIYQSKFVNNIALIGAAVYISPSQSPGYGVPLCNLFLEDVVVNDNYRIAINTYNETRGGAIYFNGVNVSINGSTNLGSQFSSNTPQGAIQGDNGFLLLSGNIAFTNNTGVNGGAISLSNNVPLLFHDTCNVQFSRNVATTFGGAIYNEGEQTALLANQDSWTLSCAIDFVGDGPFSITFTNNHAELGGHAVYATPIYGCSGANPSTYFTITPLPEDLNDTQVLSFPANVQLCACSNPNMCNITSQYEGKVTTYPGRTVRLNVTSVDCASNISPSVVYTHIDTDYPHISLGPLQSVQWIGSKCTSMEYQIYGPEMASLRLLLSNYPGYSPTMIEIQLLPCEPGFTLMSDSSSGLMECDCCPFLTSHGVLCDASDGTVTRHGTNWIGVYNFTLPALASTCPLDYCNNGITKLSLARPRNLCNGGRTGILCGHCHGNQSAIFGSSECQVCSDMWLITLVMFAVLGVLLVAALFFLNLTVTQGTLYGLIFYANIVQVNTSIFFNQSILKPLQVFVSFVNLDLGVPLCFYDGMDDADKAGLQFVFPAYLLILTMTVIVLCHYCLQRSPATSSSSCLYRLPIIIGERAVGVLSTLIYLSYSKLLRTVIDVFTYSTVHLPSGDIYVWFYDGNLEYLHGKHIALFVVAMVTCTLFLLPYTFAITFIPIIEQYSEHNRLFNYLHNKANQIKPMNDTHYAPYKWEWQWWLGARLWLLVVMNGLNPMYCSNQPSLLLSIQATVVIMFTVVQATVQPFGQPLQMTEKYNRHTYCYNQLYNCLDLFYLLNYAVLALSMSYILDHGSDKTHIVVCVGVLVGLFVVVLMVTVLYHLMVAILKACKM